MENRQNHPRLKTSIEALHSRLSGGKLNDSLIAERVTTLLSHYWTAAEDERLRALQISDWLDDLGEFPAMIVADSCALWRRSYPGKRPTPGDIRQLCREVTPRKREAPKPMVMLPQVEHDPSTVRDNWQTLEWPNLTEAEKKLFTADLPEPPTKKMGPDWEALTKPPTTPDDPELLRRALENLGLK